MAPWDRGQSRVKEGAGGAMNGGGWHDILSIISEVVTFTRGNRRGAAPGAVQGFVMYVQDQGDRIMVL